MPVYNKLVRDRIPEIIEKAGKTAETRILDDAEYYKLLVEKLSEEVREFTESDTVEEIADILEVLDAVLKAKGVTWEEARKVQEAKRLERGGFDGKVLLVEVKG